MKSFFSILSFLILSLCTLPGLKAQMTFEATLSGQQEVPAIATPASGSVTATLMGNTLTVEGIFSGLTGLFDPTIAGGAHIHMGYAGENGDVAVLLTTTPVPDLSGGSFEPALNTFTLDAAQVEALMERRFYINIHTTLYPGGELRGQLLPAADATFSANLFGSNEVPSIMTRASGGLQLELSGDELTVSGSFSGLEGDFDANIAGGAHLHLGMAGENGGVEIGLNATTAADLKSGFFAAEDNTFTLTSTQLAALAQRNLYVNIHTTEFPAGELRAQVVGNADAVFRAHLSGSNEWPVVTSMASGSVILEVDGDQLVVSGTFDDLGSAVDTDIAGGAHLHIAAAGANGPVAIPLNLDLDTDMQGGALLAADNTFILEADQLEALFDRMVYVNIHTEGNAAGELRGQVLNQCEYVLTAFLSGNQEIPDVTTTGHGMVKAEISGNTMVATGSFNELQADLNIDIGGGAHIHTGLPGQNGDVAFALTSAIDGDATAGVFMPAMNTFTLNADQRAELEARAMYVNIHSFDFPAGEIRGNLMGEATAYFLTPLSGASEAPAIRTNATGMLAVELQGENAICVGSFQDLEGTFDANIAGGAHLHSNYAGSNGGVVFLLDATTEADLQAGVFAAADNRFSLTTGQLDTLLQRGYYANLHTSIHQAGELRGQVLPLAQTYFHTTLMGLNEVPVVMTEAMGGLKFELTGNILTCTGSFSELETAYDMNVGSHLHLAGNGMNGDVSVVLDPSVAADMLSGVYLAADNTFELTSDQVAAIRSGDFYVNIHTEGNAAGELRGQIVSEINTFPEASNIAFPTDGALINILGSATTDLEVTWPAVSDADGDNLAYIWQLAADEEFTTLLLQENVGDAQAFITSYGAIDALLEANGVMVGTSVTLYHRVVVSDGSNANAGVPSSAEFDRGEVTSTADVLSNQYELRGFPTITGGQPLTVEVTAQEATEAQLVITDGLGRVQMVRELSLAPQTQRFTMEVDNLGSGTYYYTLLIDGRSLPVQRFIRQ